MRKEMFAVAVLALVATVTTGLANSLSYSDSSATPYKVYKPGGAAIEAAENWVIALYQDVALDGADPWNAANILDPTGDDTLLGISTSVGNPWNVNPAKKGCFSAEAIGVFDAMRVFARVFNSNDFTDDTNIGTASQYVNLGVWTLTDPAPDNAYYTVNDPDGNGILTWVTSGSKSDGSDWQSIPEPASLALFGVGLVTMALRNRFRK